IGQHMQSRQPVAGDPLAIVGLVVIAIDQVACIYGRAAGGGAGSHDVDAVAGLVGEEGVDQRLGASGRIRGIVRACGLLGVGERVEEVHVSLLGNLVLHAVEGVEAIGPGSVGLRLAGGNGGGVADKDRKSTRLNSSHVKISYAVFCLKKKK